MLGGYAGGGDQLSRYGNSGGDQDTECWWGSSYGMLVGTSVLGAPRSNYRSTGASLASAGRGRTVHQSRSLRAGLPRDGPYCITSASSVTDTRLLHTASRVTGNHTTDSAVRHVLGGLACCLPHVRTLVRITTSTQPKNLRLFVLTCFSGGRTCGRRRSCRG